MKLKTTILLFAATVAAHATPVTLSRNEATRLYIALNSIQSGLGGPNVVVASDDINVITPDVLSYRKGQEAAQRQINALPKTPAGEAQGWKIHDDIEVKGDESKVYDLEPLTLTDDEIKDSKISPTIMSPILLYLKPQPAKAKK